MDGSGSEKSQTRHSTPVPDLDDHRDVLPSHHGSYSHESAAIHRDSRQRRPTLTSLATGNLDIRIGADGLLSAGPVSRDFEQAIIDDNGSRTELNEGGGQTLSPMRPRHISRVHTEEKEGHMRPSRDSSSTRSSSPPNSIDAFADGRRVRERANTFGSRSRRESEIDIPLIRTLSGGTHRRRPTFDHASVRPTDGLDDRDQLDDTVNPGEPIKTFMTVDYEEIEEFVAESTRGRVPHAPRQRFSYATQGYLNAKKTGSLKPKIDTPTIITPMSLRRKHEIDVFHKEQYGDYSEKSQLSESQLTTVAEEKYRFSFFSSEIEHTIHTPEIGDLVEPGTSFRDLFEIPPEGGTWWLDVQCPTEDELEMFQKAFDIHKLTAEDIQSQEPREKVELFSKYYFVCFRSFRQDKNSEDYMDPVNVYMVVFRDGIITFTFNVNPHAEGVRRRIGKNRNYIDLTADWICYALVDNIVDSFGPVIQSIESETDQIEDQVFVARHTDFATLLRQIGECRKRVMSLMRLLGGKADVIKGFAKRCNEQYSVTPRGEIGLYLGDIQDHVVTMMSSLGHVEKMLSRSHANYLAQLSVDQISQGNRANEVLGKITVIATVLVPLNLVCGLFGMNVPVPGRNSESLAWFGGIVGFLAVCVCVSFLLAKRMRFI